MNSIFKKLSIILCCLFSLFFVNPVTLATPGDYLVYFLGKDYKDKGYRTLECGKCEKYLHIRAGQFCCCSHCFKCGCLNGNCFALPTEYRQCSCEGIIPHCSCVSIWPSSAFCYLKQYGPFCFIKYENGGNMNTVFENAKKSNQLYCAYCMAKELKDNFNGTIFSNVPAEINYKVTNDARISDAYLRKKTFKATINPTFKLNNDIPDGNSLCFSCENTPDLISARLGVRTHL